MNRSNNPQTCTEKKKKKKHWPDRVLLYNTYPDVHALSSGRGKAKHLDRATWDFEGLAPVFQFGIRFGNCILKNQS